MRVHADLRCNHTKYNRTALRRVAFCLHWRRLRRAFAQRDAHLKQLTNSSITVTWLYALESCEHKIGDVAAAAAAKVYSAALKTKRSCRNVRRILVRGSMPSCRLRRRKFRKFDYKMVHSEVYLNKYVVSKAPFSTPACPNCSENIT